MFANNDDGAGKVTKCVCQKTNVWTEIQLSTQSWYTVMIHGIHHFGILKCFYLSMKWHRICPKTLVLPTVRTPNFTNFKMLNLQINKLQQQLINFYTIKVHFNYKVCLKTFCLQFGAVSQSAKSKGVSLWRRWHSWMGAVSAGSDWYLSCTSCRSSSSGNGKWSGEIIRLGWREFCFWNCCSWISKNIFWALFTKWKKQNILCGDHIRLSVM